MALTAYVTARLGHCEIEEVACGRGLELIYEFLCSDPTFRCGALFEHAGCCWVSSFCAGHSSAAELCVDCRGIAVLAV
jgi:glucokinase